MSHTQRWRASAEDKRARFDCSYVESPAKLEKEFQVALERKRQELAEQREEIRRMAAFRRAGH